MYNTILEFCEEEDFKVNANQLDRDTARSIFDLYKGKVSILEPGFERPDYYILRSSGFVGQIPVNEDLLIKINPKITVSNLFCMLEYAYDLKSFHLLEGNIGVDVVEEIYERLASILASRVLNRVSRGLYRDYIEEEAPLTYLRGKCLMMRSFRNSMRGSLHLDCEYEENTADLEDNRILAWTLYWLPRLPIKREDVRFKVKKAYRSLAGSVNLEKIDPSACVGRIYHRMNEDYRPMHGLCRFFLEHCGPGMEVGDRDFLPFLLSMPNLFESFVANWFNMHLPAGLKMVVQYSTKFDELGHFKFAIDLVLMDVGTDKVLAILDTKYKRHEKPSNEDINQVVAYALHMNTENAFLVYPSFNTEAIDIEVGSDKKVKVRSLVFDLEGNLEDSGQEMLGKLQSYL